ncbi:solute carrier family 2, facilitated glucose transporter member 8-like [Clytia hemisphaerica]|uniref:Major facilitator superfamily (MFS) profile domain-containing protein n=1 Tax=Clytia hemisphaerica TaxID=252671 RepID=A0A7M5V119_9CNID
MASARGDIFIQNDSAFEGKNNKDKMWTACFAAFSAALATVNFGYALGFTAEAELLLQFNPNFNVNSTKRFAGCTEDFDFFASVVALGALAGGLMGGILIDRIGRKATIISTSIFYGLGWLLISYSYCYPKGAEPTQTCENHSLNYYLSMVYTGRVITGVGAGMSSLVVPVYIAEIASARMRGALGNINQLSINFGFVVAYLTGYKQNLPTTAYVPIGISILNLILMVFFLPETPRYLLANNRRHDAILALYWLRGQDYPVEEECFEIEGHVNFGTQEQWQWKDLKSSTFYWPLIIALFLMFFQEFSGINCILFYCTSIFFASGIGAQLKPGDTHILDTLTKGSEEYAIYVCFTLFIFTGISCFLVDRFGRRKLLLSGSVGMFISLILVSVYVHSYPVYYNNVDDISNFFSKQENTTYAILAFVCILCFIAMFSIGWGPLPWLLMSELFPIKTRGIATTIVTLSNWLFVFTTTSSFCFLVNKIHIYGAMWIFATIVFIGFFFTLFFVPETRGRPLEEVAELFIRRKVLQVSILWTRHDASM